MCFPTRHQLVWMSSVVISSPSLNMDAIWEKNLFFPDQSKYPKWMRTYIWTLWNINFNYIDIENKWNLRHLFLFTFDSPQWILYKLIRNACSLFPCINNPLLMPSVFFHNFAFCSYHLNVKGEIRKVEQKAKLWKNTGTWRSSWIIHEQEQIKNIHN